MLDRAIEVLSKVDQQHTNPYNPFSVLNLSQASFSVAKTAALIIRCSVVAVCEIYVVLARPQTDGAVVLSKAYLIGMDLRNGLHINDFYLVGHDQITHVDLLPSRVRPQHLVKRT